MSTGGRRGRGRPPKSSLSGRSHLLRKPKYTKSQLHESDSGNSGGNSRSSTPVSTTSSTPTGRMSTRARGRDHIFKSRSYFQHLTEDDNEMSEDDEIAGSVSDFDDELGLDEGNDSDFTLMDDGVSVCSAESDSTFSSTPGKRKYFPRRPRTPEFIDEKDIPPLVLPTSSTDLLLENEHILQAIGIYEVLRHFRVILRLSPYRFEDFCAALVSDEQNCLLAETHIALLRALQRNDESTSTTFGPSDLKDSMNICLYFVDAMTWPEVIRAYLESDRSPEFRSALPSLESPFYSQLSVKERLHTLQTLTDLFLSTNCTREEIMNEGNIKYDDHCRACHRLGDLLCCETCSAVYHLACVEPAMEEVPEDDWHCNVCTAHQVKGVTDCISDTEKHGLMCRQDPIGYDRHGRKYWFLARRIFIDGVNEVWYYSTPQQITEVLEVLDQERWERHLCHSLHEIREDVKKHMGVTESLTMELKGNKKSAIELETTSLTKIQTERAERRIKEEAERKAREEEERKRRIEEERKRIEEQAKFEEEEERRKLSEAGWFDETKSMETTSTTTNTSNVVSTVTNSGEGVGSAFREHVSTTSTTVTTVTTTKVVTSTSEAGDGNQTDPKDTAGQNDQLDKEVDVVNIDQKSATNDQSLVTGGEAKPTASEAATTQATLAPKTTVLITKDGNKVMLAMVKPDPDGAATSQSEGDSTSTTVLSSSTTTTTTTAAQETRRILTRSRTGSLTPKVFTDSIVGSFKLSTKSSSDEVLVINKDGDMSTIQKSKTTLSVFNQKFFKLGMETTYKQWVNQYSTNSLALNKHQHNEDRDRRRFLSHKFSLTPLSEFKWNGSVFGNSAGTVATLRGSILQFENNIASAFLHSSWPAQRQNWIKAVNMCEKPQDFALALAILEACIKPVLFNPVWNDSLGHTRMQRITSAEREDIKKREKEARRQQDSEEDRERMTWIKYTLGLKHQVYKQKGEEYRVHGNGGWLWLASIRFYRLVPQDSVGLRRIAKMLNYTRRKAKEVKNSSEIKEEIKEEPVEETNMEVDPPVTKTPDAASTEAGEDMEVSDSKLPKEVANEAESKNDAPAVKMETEDSSKKIDSDKPEEKQKIPEEKFNPAEEAEMKAAVKMLDSVPPTALINISEGLLKRTHYPKFKKTAGKLDGLLERRVKQFELEQKQKAAIESVIAKYKQQDDVKKKVVPSNQTKLEEGEVDVVNVKTEPEHPALSNGDIKTEEEDKTDVKSEPESKGAVYSCYSSVCRQSKSSPCYSVSCQGELVCKVKDEPDLNVVKTENGAEKMDSESVADESHDASSSNSSTTSSSNPEKKLKKAGGEEGSSSSGSSTSILKSNNSSSSSSSTAASKSTTTVTTLSNTAVGQTIAALIQGGKIQLTSANVSDLEIKLAQVGKTEFPVSLARLQRGPRNKSKMALRKGSLPVCHKFLTKSRKRSLFILEKHELKSLARIAGMKETKGFNYNCKMNNVNWVYPCPRPRFKTAWRYRTQNLKTVASAAIQLRVMWAAIRWDDMAVKPPAGGTNTVTTETDITTKELLKRRDVGPYGLQSEFLVRKIVVPIGVPAQPREKYTPQRSGLRERKRPESPKIKEPSLTEAWVPEEDLELWEIKVFGEKVEKQRAAIQEKLAQQQQVQKVATSATATVSAKSGQTPEELRAQMEAQLKQQRLAMQQKRLAEQQGQQTTAQSTTGRSIVLNSTIADVSKSTTVIQLSSLQQPQQKTMLIAPGNSKSLPPVRVLTSGASLASSVAGSAIKVTPIKPAGQVGQQKQIQISPKTIFTGTGGRYGGQVQLPATTITVRPKATLSTAVASVPTVKSIAPSTVVSAGQTVRIANNTVQVRPAATSTVAASPAPAPATGQVQNLRIIQGPNGQIQVQGLLPGQQIIRLPDGRLQLLTLPTTQVQAPQPQPQVQPQLPAQVAVSAQPTPQKQIQLVQNQVQIRPQTALVAAQPNPASIAIAAPTLSAASAAPTIIVSSAMAAAATPTLAAATVAAPTTQLRMPVSSLAGTPKLVQVPGVGGTTRLVLASPQVTAQPTIVRTPSGQQVLIRPQAAPVISAAPAPLLLPTTPTAPVVTNKPVVAVAPPPRLATTQAAPTPVVISPQPEATAPATSTPTKPSPTPQKTPVAPATPGPATPGAAPTPASTVGGKYSLTTQVLQQVVRQAMLQNQDPEIQAKLVAMQKQMSTKKEPEKAATTAPPTAPITSNLAEAAKPKTKPLTAEQREEQARMSVSVQVMKGMLDKIEREEKQEQKRQRKAESAEEKQKRILANKLQALLYKQKETLKKDMMKKRALMEKALSTEIQSEVTEVVKAQRKKAGKKRREDITSGSDSEFEPPKQKKKKRVVMPGKGLNPREKLYCVCKKPYDDTKFYIGCDLCSNWFHGRCVGISEDKAQFIDSYICDTCKKQQETASEELYCICRTPYDETQFYIGCDQCQDWFHGRCVGVTKAEADHMDSYICPNCQNTNNETATAQILVNDSNFDELRRILNGLKSHKMAWPFLEPVNQEEVPDYYRVIKEPMDMSRVEQKLLSREYAVVGDYIKDVTKIFDNCRYYNPTDSPFYRCAEVLETLFVQKLKALKDKL